MENSLNNAESEFPLKAVDYEDIREIDGQDTRQSITIRNYNLVSETAKIYRWKINELVNYSLEIYFAFLDIDLENKSVTESQSFMRLKEYAKSYYIEEKEAIRYAIDIFSGLYTNNSLVKIQSHQLVKGNKRTVQGIISELLSEYLKDDTNIKNRKDNSKKISIKTKRVEISRFAKNKSSERKSITIKNHNVIRTVAEFYRWTINELVNYSLEIFLSLLDINIKKEQVIESVSFSRLKEFAQVHGMQEGQTIRYAINIFSRLYHDGIFKKIQSSSLEEKSIKKAIPLLVTDSLKNFF
ncbi:hypothetical protein [Candidatus Uabimicrobium amorphum]|uniref:Uncharacterized protein n=1 Tax=Uabimicrobium amorphum TaxID=2596890 RepID=A0A5S9IN98_UABAM|nr:hypothetical protein [Candidatus Uabimicrobium amorphum]BBM84461.1 hypothetical protein UABAM_02822 [Candidatus Uabimicrobium amorphum]